MRSYDLSDDTILLISYPGELFMRLLKLFILPLMISCLISGTASLNARMNGRIAVRTLIYFVSTSFFNALFGLCLVLLIQPGIDKTQETVHHSTADMGKTTNLLDSLLDLGRYVLICVVLQTRLHLSIYFSEIFLPTICSKHHSNRRTPCMCHKSL